MHDISIASGRAIEALGIYEIGDLQELRPRKRPCVFEPRMRYRAPLHVFASLGGKERRQVETIAGPLDPPAQDAVANGGSQHGPEGSPRKSRGFLHHGEQAPAKSVTPGVLCRDLDTPALLKEMIAALPRKDRLQTPCSHQSLQRGLGF